MKSHHSLAPGRKRQSFKLTRGHMEHHQCNDCMYSCSTIAQCVFIIQYPGLVRGWRSSRGTCPPQRPPVVTHSLANDYHLIITLIIPINMSLSQSTVCCLTAPLFLPWLSKYSNGSNACAVWTRAWPMADINKQSIWSHQTGISRKMLLYLDIGNKLNV